MTETEAKQTLWAAALALASEDHAGYQALLADRSAEEWKTIAIVAVELLVESQGRYAHMLASGRRWLS